MTERSAIWATLAAEQPATFWFVESTVFYGIMSLLYDLSSFAEWSLGAPWPGRLIGSILFGGLMLGLARRKAKHAHLNDQGHR